MLSAVGLLLAGCGGAAQATADGSSRASGSHGGSATSSASYGSDPWANEPIDTIGVGVPPAFPRQLDQWTLTGQWSGLPRAFVQADEEWTVTVGPNATPFPATMNGCDDGRFLVRWRAVDDGVNVIAAAGRPDDQMGVDGPVLKQASGHSGWMDLDGCYAPVFRMEAPLSSGQNLEDVTVEVQEYQPAP